MKNVSSEMDWSQETVDWPALFSYLILLDFSCRVIKKAIFKNKLQNTDDLQDGKRHEIYK